MLKTFYIINLGCRVNLYESISIAGQMINCGYKQVKNINNADICIINTCSVTSRADAKSRYFINKANNIKQINLIIVCGCFSQINYEKIIDKAHIIIGNVYKSNITKLIDEYLKKQQKIIKIIEPNLITKYESFPSYSYDNNTKGFIKIQDGCDYMCSYCLIPFARGRQRSVSPEIVISTIEKLINEGIYEIVLTGVNTAGYKYENCSFYDLLKMINELPGDFRVRISSIEPFQISHEIIDLITSNKKRWVQEFHLCLQSAHNKILLSMNRKYTIEQFYELCKYIRTKNKLASISTDYIVGFNNETIDTFNYSIKWLNKIKFSFMNIFPYSQRTLTLSAKKNENVVDLKTKFIWTKRLQEYANKWTHEYLKKFINKIVTVYFEKSKNNTQPNGYCEYFFKVYVNTKTNLNKKVLPVKIIKLEGNKLYGKITNTH